MAAHPPIEEKGSSSPSTPSRATDSQDIEAAAIPKLFPEEGQPPRDIHGWKWGLGGKLYSRPEETSC